MDDLFANDERIFSDEDLLLGNADEAWNCDGCPPPVFNLPPPPRPPWLEDLDDCGSKGSITLSGVSLTVNEASESTFGVNLIPHTLAATNLKDLASGALNGLAFDPLRRHSGT